MATANTDVEEAVYTIVQCFYKNSRKDGEQEALSVEEFKSLVKQEFPNTMKDSGDLEENMKCYDHDKNGLIKFSEYWELIGNSAKYFKRQEKKKP